MDNFGEQKSSQIVVQGIITIVFVVGAFANIIALCILRKSSKVRNGKHVLMLRCLASNDLLAQIGMLLVLQGKIHHMIPVRWQCIMYVCLRAFGIGSGCVACVMAIERWLALTRPFVYEKLITHAMLKRLLFTVWSSSIVLTYLPFVGLGSYYKDEKCQRYREATELKDVIYAYMFLFFGTSLIMAIVFCNLSIIWELWRVARVGACLRRYSRSNISKAATPEEVAFVKLMTTICIVFIVCWMPQMVSIPLAQFYSQTRFYQVFGKIADLLMCIYFMINPYVYVLHRVMRRGRLTQLCGNSLKPARSRSTSSNGATFLTTDGVHLNNYSPLPN